MTHYIFLLTLLFAPGAGAAPAPVSDGLLSYKDAVQYALDHAPSLQTAKARASIADLDRRSAFSGFLPSLDLTSTHGYVGENPVSPATAATPWTSLTSLRLTETLWDNGETYTKYRISSLAEDRSELELRLAREKIVLDLHQEFQRYSLAHALNVVEREQYTLLKKQHDLMAEQFRAGMKSREDYVRVQAQLQRAELGLLKAANDIERSKRELVKILGVPVESNEAESWKFAPLEAGPIRTEDEPKAPPVPTGTLAYQANALQRKANELTVSLTSRKVWPQLSLTGNLGYELGGYLGTGARLADTDKLSYGGALTLTFNLWDWGTRRRDTQVAEKNRWIQDRELAEKEQSDRASIETLWLELGRAKKSYAISKELLALETSNFKTLESDYRRGVVRYLDLITGLRDLAAAKSAFLSAYFEYRQNLALHRYYEGKLYETTMAN
jgi:outer membrane protein